MSADKPSFYITTPIYYVNDVPHIGHAYTTLACDMLARFKRLDGFDVRFLTGTDEHGQKVQKSAAAAGEDPQAFCDRVSERFKGLLAAMDFTNDQFIRTTEDRHKQAAQALWHRIAANGHIYLDSYAGWYAVRDEAFYGENELSDGPDGTKIAPSGAPVEWVEEESYFFDLSAWQQPLLDFYDANPDFVLPRSRLNEVRSFVAGGLRDLSISRTTFDWGVPVPDAPGHIMYVWIDALTNYITALDFPDTGPTSTFAKYWPQALHIVGKDILRFHAVYWPAFLMAADLAPPARVFAHGWWTKEGQKISKSLGNVLDPFDLVERFGRDPVRYFMMREVPFGNDGDFSADAFVTRCNADLANGIGNLAQRTLSMIHKNCDGRVPEPGALSTDDQAFWQQVDSTLTEVRPHMDAQALHTGLETVWSRVAAADAYISAQQPWALKKTDPDRMNTVLYVVAEAVRQLAILMQPIVPAAAGRLLDQLGQGADARHFQALGPGHRLTPGTPIAKPQGVFPRIEAEEGV